MARKSRKPNNQPQTIDFEPSLLQTAAYVRLSMEDLSHKGDSIESQKRIISHYINERTDFELYDIYVDAGVSGTTFERPNFQRMMCDAEAGKIKCIMVKDLSRLGRNVIDTGYYAERVLPKLGVRLISVNDNYDSEVNRDSASLPLINLFNEAYAFDISRKTKSQKRQAMEDGIYVGGQPPYGYIRSSNNRSQLVVDDPAAETVRKIFEWAANKVSAGQIARKLNTVNIPSPGSYRYAQRPSKDGRYMGSGLWYARTINRILANEIYRGCLVQGKTKAVQFKRKQVPPAEWIHADGSHEAIVTTEIFEAVRLLRQDTHVSLQGNPTGSYAPNIFKGKIYCAHCGRHLERKKNHDKYIFRCISNRMAPGVCEGIRISEDAVRQALSEQLLQYHDALSSNLSGQPLATNILSELRWIKMEMSRIQNMTRSLYENLVKGILNQRDYMELKSRYGHEEESLMQRATTLKQALEDEKAANRKRLETKRILNEFVDALELTKKHVDRFVDRIVVFGDGKVHINFFVN